MILKASTMIGNYWTIGSFHRHNVYSYSFNKSHILQSEAQHQSPLSEPSQSQPFNCMTFKEAAVFREIIHCRT